MIHTLTDPEALRLLSLVAGPHLRAASPEAPPPAALLAALADTFGGLPETAAQPPADGDLARAALALAAADPATAGGIEVLLEDGTPPTMGVVETVAVVTAALAILQTEVTFERTTTGKVRVKLHKRAASDGLLKGLAQLLMKALGGAGGAPPKLPG